MHRCRHVVMAAGVCCLVACTDGAGAGGQLFRLVTPAQTGISFANTVTTSDSLNVQTDPFTHNGAGVAVGDIDNDGLADVFLSGNMVSSRLYLNKGGMRFEDITERAGVSTSRWATGVSMVDINADGYLDIHVSVAGPAWRPGKERGNLLFINNGDRTFREAADEYGIADTSFTTHAAFLDYDGDRDLDLFLLNNSPEDFSRGEGELHPAGAASTSRTSHDRLYRNNGNGSFTDVSREAGILEKLGYGLGVAIADINRDGRPDIYVSNDLTPNDILYVNNGDGTFSDKAAQWLKRTSYAGMGVDVADFNNDGWPDILQADMMPEALRDQKRMSGSMTYAVLNDLERRGFRLDYSLNSLQLSNGVSANGDVIFSEISRLAGVAHTEWSWSALFADFDNDGLKDVFISNGYPKATNDYDYQTAMQREKRIGGEPEDGKRRGLGHLARLHGYLVSNYVFRNAGDLTFDDVSEDWGVDQRAYSYGAAYADLDNDGALDLVVNNIDQPAFVHENVRAAGDSSHFLRIRLEGEAPNTTGIGASVAVRTGSREQHVYHSPYRGFMSTVEGTIHFGLGAARRVDTLQVTWPDGRRQVLTGLDADRLVTVRQSQAQRQPAAAEQRPRTFEPLPALRAPAYVHRTSSLIDYAVQPLLPYMVSRQGPALAAADVNGDGLHDLFVGGSSNAHGELFLQRGDGSFVRSTATQPWTTEPLHEDWGALFFDANADGLPDLYVASGGYHLAPSSVRLQDRLYINRGSGSFARDSVALPRMLTSTAAVRAGDFTGDGRPDLFVGGRLSPLNYPAPTGSYLLRNDGGRFTDVTDSVAPELARLYGMVTDAAWIDFDGDRKLDLVTVGEWMPIQFFRNEGGRFRNVTRATRLPPQRGWWFSLAAGDFDGDGRTDLVAGNLGLNHSYQASPEAPFGIYASDFTGSRTTDIVLTQRVDGVEYPAQGLATLGRALYPLRLRYQSFASFADARLDQVFPEEQLDRALHYDADTFASVFLRNEGGGVFTSRQLPNMAQIAPIRGIVVHDIDGDGNLDLIVAGNLYDAEPNTPRADAGNGLWLRGDGKGAFTPVPPVASGFLAPRNASGLALVGRTVIVANTGDSLQAFTIR